MTDKPEMPDLRSLLAEASPPSSSVTVPLKQGLAEKIRQAEDDLANISQSSPAKRMGAKSPLRAKAEELAGRIRAGEDGLDSGMSECR